MTRLPSQRSLPARIRQRPARAYTLSQVRDSVEQLLAIEASRPGASQLKTPAMQTLKLWSQQGMFQAAATLADAAQFVMSQVTAAPGRYANTIKPRAAIRRVPSDVPGDIPDGDSAPGYFKPSLVNSSSMFDFTAEATPDSAVHLKVLAHLLASFEEVKNRMTESDRINNMVYSELRAIKERLHQQDQHDLQSTPVDAKDAPTPKESAEEEGDRAAIMNFELIRAIDQLDAIGRHTLVSLDREVQAMKNGLQAQRTNNSQDGVSPLDVQRILARLSNVEQNTIRIVQFLDTKFEQ